MFFPWCFHVFPWFSHDFHMMFPWFSMFLSMISPDFHMIVHDFSEILTLNVSPAGHLALEQMILCTPNKRHCGGQGGCTGATAELAFQFVKDAGGSGDPGFSDSGDTFFWLDIRNDSGDTNMTGYKKYYYEFDVFEYLVGIICRFVSKWVALPLAS